MITIPVIAVSQVPTLMNYQGKLMDDSGEPVQDGYYMLTFRLYDVPVGGTAIWTENQVINIENGLFNVLLGSQNPIVEFPRDSAYLAISVNQGNEMGPRKRIVSVGYAFESQHSLEADTAVFAYQAITAGNATTLEGNPAAYFLPITAYGHVDAVTCQPSQWTTLLEVDISIPDTMLVFSFGTVSGAGWIDGQRMLQLSIMDENYTTFYPYANPWGDVANAYHLLPGGTYHIQLYGVNLSGSVQDMGDISIFAFALYPTTNNTFRSGPFAPPADAQLPDPSNLVNRSN
jgi:hypothetical protein